MKEGRAWSASSDGVPANVCSATYFTRNLRFSGDAYFECARNQTTPQSNATNEITYNVAFAALQIWNTRFNQTGAVPRRRLAKIAMTGVRSASARIKKVTTSPITLDRSRGR